MYLGGILAGLDPNASSFEIPSAQLKISEDDNHPVVKGYEPNVWAAFGSIWRSLLQITAAMFTCFYSQHQFSLPEHQIIFRFIPIFLEPELCDSLKRIVATEREGQRTNPTGILPHVSMQDELNIHRLLRYTYNQRMNSTKIDKYCCKWGDREGTIKFGTHDGGSFGDIVCFKSFRSNRSDEDDDKLDVIVTV
jgi:hypothetical protein